MHDRELMDSNDLKELWRVAKKLKKSDALIGPLSGQPQGLPIGKDALGECAAELPIPSFVEGPRMAEDMVQFLLWPVDMLRMHETDPEVYRHWAFQLVILV